MYLEFKNVSEDTDDQLKIQITFCKLRKVSEVTNYIPEF